MAANSQSEGYARFTYVSTQGVHHGEININFSGIPEQGAEPTLVKRDTTTAAATAALAGFFDEYVKFFDDDTNFGNVEIYAVDPETEERSFIWSYNLNMQGAAVTSNVALGMLTMTWRTGKGGILRVVMMEGVAAVNQNLAPPYITDTPFSDLDIYVRGDDAVLIGRDDAYAFSAMSAKSKTSDVLRKKRDQ
jgi:hypothetical protein